MLISKKIEGKISGDTVPLINRFILYDFLVQYRPFSSCISDVSDIAEAVSAES
jgi:hypothetical protein